MSKELSPTEILWAQATEGAHHRNQSLHLNTCTHQVEHLLLLKDAERVAVFWNPARNTVHYSITLRGWFDCQWVGQQTYLQWIENPKAEMDYLKNRIRSLEQMIQ